MRAPHLYIIAGPNGAGKSTFQAASGVLNEIPFVNADNIAKEAFEVVGAQESMAAQQEARDRIDALLKAGKDFCFETVFSHESKIELIRKAQAHNFKVGLFVVCNDDSNINIIRVKERVAAGGHDVPIDRILTRRPRTLANLKVAISLVDAFQIVDTSGGELEIVASKDFDSPYAEILADTPEWARDILGEVGVDSTR